ncbi:hypothetical protein [Eremococcus coleocola]|uniref:hypothetical protein n=1 Tax=Eremococcus coleocola TaxID=88132 RepID=UPI0009D6CC13|nr:hypothetical protein [Eremococcus coleocola]
MKAIALGNVHALYQRLRPEITIIGTGGDSNGRDVFEMVLCGASMVQVASALAAKGSGIFTKLNQELSEIMKLKRYQTIEEFKGQLRHL